MKFYILFFEGFGNLHPYVVERKVVVERGDLLKVANLKIDDGKLSGEVVNLGSSAINNVVVSCDSREVFVGKVNPQSAKPFEIECDGKTLKVKAKNAIGNVIEVEKELPSQKGFSLWWFAAIIILAIVVLLAVASYRRRI